MWRILRFATFARLVDDRPDDDPGHLVTKLDAFTQIVATSKMPVTVRMKKLTGGIGHWGDLGTCL